MQHVIDKTEELIFKEMEKINSKGEISSADLCNLKYASATLMNLETYGAMKEEYGEDASFEMSRRSMRGGSRQGGGGSQRRGRGRNGQFVSRGMDFMDDYSYEDEDMSFARGGGGSREGGSRRGGSYADGYSGHSVEDKTIMMLEHQMDNATSEYDKNFLRQQIKAIRENQMK